MAIIPSTVAASSKALGLQNAGNNISITEAPSYLDANITPGSRTFNFTQGYYAGNYSPFSGPWTDYRYLKDLTGGTIYGYASSLSRTTLNSTSAGGAAGGTNLGGYTDAAMWHVSQGSTASGAYDGPHVTYGSSTPNSMFASKPKALQSGTYGVTSNSSATGSSGQFYESLSQTFSYQRNGSYGQAVKFNTTGSMGSWPSSQTAGSGIEWTAANGDKFTLHQLMWGKNTNTSGNFPNMNGPYNGSHRTGDNVGNWAYMFFYHSSGNNYTNLTQTSADAANVFSHVVINGSSGVLKSPFPNAVLGSGQSSVGTASLFGAGPVTSAYRGFGILWTGLTDSQINAFGTTSSSTINIKIQGPVSTISYKNGIAEEHGGADSSDVKLGDYLKGAPAGYVPSTHSSTTIKTVPSGATTGFDQQFSDYFGTSFEAAYDTKATITSASDGQYYPHYGFGLLGAGFTYNYPSTYIAKAAFGSSSPSAPIFSINNKGQKLISAYYKTSPAGYELNVITTPQSGNYSDLLSTSDFSGIYWKKLNSENSNANNTLATTVAANGYNVACTQTITSTAQASGEIVPRVQHRWNWDFTTYSTSSGNNLAYNWRTDNGTITAISNFEVEFYT